jgi:integrase
MQNEWRVMYYDDFNVFIDEMYDHFYDLIKCYEETNANVRIFRNSSRNLHYQLQKLYRDTNNGMAPPYGFGMHIFRYLAASRLASSGHMDIAKTFLSHKQMKTTEIYVRHNATQLEHKLNQINDINDLYKQIMDR